MSWTISRMANFAFFGDSSGPRPANGMFSHGLLKINIWLNWLWPWQHQNPNCPNDLAVWITSGTRPQNHAVFKNVKKSTSSHIGLRHELDNFQNGQLCFLLGHLQAQACKWYVFVWAAKNQYLTELVWAMTTTKPKLSQWPSAVGYIWHQPSKSRCF